MLTRWDKRRYSDVRGCCGWWRSWSGCEPVRVARRAGRHGRRGKTLAPQWAAKQCWTELPEANRRVAVGWLTVEEAAERLNTSPRFVRRLVFERRIAFLKLGRHVRITEHDLDTYVRNCRVNDL
jgi:excisionase family DNA binding protein